MNEYIYGRNPAIEVLKNKKVDKLYLQKGNRDGSIKKIYSMAKEDNILITEVGKSKLDQMSNGANHQGVVALVSGFKYSSIEDILKEDKKVIILDKLEDPHNLGAIARSAEAFSFDSIIIPKHKSVYVNDVVYKTSAGAIDNLKVAIETNLTNTIEKLKKENFWVYGADLKGDKYFNSDFKGKVVLVIGNEGKGISQNIKKHCDKIISIPMSGKINSLNASCAASILMAEIQRQNEEA
ncbi:MAG: 23S rRNA (guanosine(2251)-2'-O)-methyltransferase RlmB [Peptoniphilaceae bacterium]